MQKLDAEDPIFQAKLLAVLIENPQVLIQYRQALTPDLWTNEDLEQLFNATVAFFDQYQRTPSYDELKVFLSKFARNEKPISGDSWDDWVDVLSKLKNTGDLKFAYDNIVDFVRYRTFQQALISCATHLEAHNFDAIETAIREAHQKRIGPQDGIEFFDDIYKRLTSTVVRECIPTGITPLDRIMGGGTAKGEMTIVLAPPGVGKTTFLINLASAAVELGATVYHFFAEQTDAVIWARYATRLLKLPYKNIRESPKGSTYILQQIQNKHQGSLRICGCLGWTVSDIRSFIYRHGIPDAIVLDYADKLRMSSHYNDYRHEIRRIYEELILLTNETGCAMWTASQTNRQALGKQKITIKDISESFDKAMIADNILALCQTEEEEKTEDMRIFLAKIRNEEGKMEIPCKVIRSKMLIAAKSDLYTHVQDVY